MGAIKTKHLPEYTVSDDQQWEGDWELIKGIPFSMSPSSGVTHQRMASKVFRLLQSALDEADSCDCELFYELDLRIDQSSVVRPDLMIICEDIKAKYPSVIPNLVVEIISPSSERKDREIKFELYQEWAIPNYLIADPASKILELFTLSGSAYKKQPLDLPIKLDQCELMVNWSSI